MEGKKFYLILIGLIVIGISSVFLYRQQQEARFLEFEGYEISAIEDQVEALYNEDKTDLAKEISAKELEELNIILSELQEKDLGRQNENRIEKMMDDFLAIQGMLALEEDIDKIFVEEDIVGKNTSLTEIEELELEIETFEDVSLYYERNQNILNTARTQVEIIETATECVEALFNDDEVIENATREDEEKALELINQVRNEEVKEDLTSRIEVLSVVLTEREEQLAQAELDALEEEALTQAELEAEEEIETETEEEDPVYVALTPPQNTETYTPPTSNNTSSSSNTNSGSNTGSTGNTSTPNPPSDAGNSSDNENSESNNPVVRVYKNTESTVIYFSTEEIRDNGLEVGISYTVREGMNGSRTVTYEITEYRDGSSDRSVVSENVENPINKQIIVGTRELDSE